MRPIDLTGKKFGHLKVRPLPSVRKKGDTYWPCLCDCGTEALVRADHLRSGRQRHCGRRCPLSRPKRRRHALTGLTKGRKAKLKATEVREDDEGTWYAGRRAAQYIKKSYRTLRLWKLSCPSLDGRGIRTKPFPDGYNGEHDYFLKCPKRAEDDPCSLDAVLAAQANQKPRPTCPGHTNIDDVCHELGVRKETIYSLARAMKRPLKRVSAKKFCRRRKGGLRAEPCLRAYVPDDVYNELKRRSIKADCQPLPQLAEPEAEEAASIQPKRRGRPRGSLDPAARRKHILIVDAWRTGQYKTVADLARAFSYERSTASKILKAAGLKE